MQDREEHIQEIKENMNNVEDKVFAAFCRRLGVKNIRQYEERELVMQQERARKRAEFEQQIDAINTQLDFEKQKDTRSELISRFGMYFRYEMINYYSREC